MQSDSKLHTLETCFYVDSKRKQVNVLPKCTCLRLFSCKIAFKSLWMVCTLRCIWNSLSMVVMPDGRSLSLWTIRAEAVAACSPQMSADSLWVSCFFSQVDALSPAVWSRIIIGPGCPTMVTYQSITAEFSKCHWFKLFFSNPITVSRHDSLQPSFQLSSFTYAIQLAACCYLYFQHIWRFHTKHWFLFLRIIQ